MGSGSVIVEAEAVGLPSIASRIYGLSDAVLDGVTGVFHPLKHIIEIAEAMLSLASAQEMRLRMGRAMRARTLGKFSEE